MKIDEIIIKLCELDSSDKMEIEVQKEMERTEKLEYSEELDEYISSLYNIYGYLMRGKFRDFKPIYQKLVDKFQK